MIDLVTIKDFKEWQKKYPNVITPDVLKVKQRGNTFVELSEGMGIDEKPLFGVTTIYYIPHKNIFETADCGNESFTSKEEAEEKYKRC